MLTIAGSDAIAGLLTYHIVSSPITEALYEPFEELLPLGELVRSMKPI
jgi:hypothetical protein